MNPITENINYIFGVKSEISDKTAELGSFVINRAFAYKYPASAQKINIKMNDPIFTCWIWRSVYKNTGSVPPWIWHKQKKKHIPLETLILEKIK